MVHALTGTIAGGTVQMDRPAEWPEGQRVLVIALPPELEAVRTPPPPELLEEDAKELATRPELARVWLGDELA